MDESQIKTFISEATADIETAPQMGEAMTKETVISNFLDLLSWELPGPTEMEFPVEAFGRQFRVDYAYVADGTAEAFLEAKGVDTPLTGDERDQLKAYLKNGAAQRGVLTNGTQYEFYQRVADPEYEVKRLAAVPLDQLHRRPQILRLFTPEKLPGGDGGIFVIQQRELTELLRDNKSEITAEITGSVVESTEEALSGSSVHRQIEADIRDEAKRMLDRLVSDFQNGEVDDEDGEDDDEEEYMIELVDGDDRVFRESASIQRELLVKSVTYLIDNESLIQQVDSLPYVPGRKRAIIHNDPVYDGEEMADPREVGGEYYVEVNLSWEQKRRELERLVELCELSVKIQPTDP